MAERFNPVFTTTLPYLKNIDKVFCNRLTSYMSRDTELSVVFEVMIHDLDIILSLAKSKVKQVSAYGERLHSHAYDVAMAIVLFDNGLEAHFTASRVAERNYSMIEFFCPEKVYKIDFLHNKAFEYSFNNKDKFLLKEAYMAQLPYGKELYETGALATNTMEDELKNIDDFAINNKKAVVSLVDDEPSMQLARQIEEEMDRHF